MRLPLGSFRVTNAARPLRRSIWASFTPTCWRLAGLAKPRTARDEPLGVARSTMVTVVLSSATKSRAGTVTLLSVRDCRTDRVATKRAAVTASTETTRHNPGRFDRFGAPGSRVSEWVLSMLTSRLVIGANQG